MEDARKTLAEVTDNVSQQSASKKDEITIMKAMLNDPNFTVGIYDKTGKVGEYCPSADARKMITNVVSTTTRISGKEAAELVDNYEFTKADATSFINISKEFINTYLQTGRKLPLGGRQFSNVELMQKNIQERITGVPSKDSKERKDTFVPAHVGIRASNPCPVWLK